ncbi:MAG: SRPBCC family protein [Anaerolineaceae bacterium]|jgi:uncharacterized protein YndB with AHSA1/START domain
MEINTQAPLVSRKEVFIQASPDKVWEIQTNINAWKDWQPGINRSQLDGALTVGALFRWTSGGFAVTSMLQEVEPRRRIAWTGNAFGSKARHIWMFKPQGDGTLVTTEESMEGWLIVLLKPLMPKFLEQSLDVWMSSLKTKGEGKANN